MNEPEPDEPQRRGIRQELAEVAVSWPANLNPGPILDALHVADRAIEAAAGAAIRGAGDVLGSVSGGLGDALSGIDTGAIAGIAVDAAGQVAETGADIAGEVLGAVVEGIGGAFSG